MENNLAEFGGVAGVTIIIMQFLKSYIPGNFVPLAAIIVAVILNNLWAVTQGTHWTSATIEGIPAGLIASGLYDQKKLLEAKK